MLFSQTLLTKLEQVSGQPRTGGAGKAVRLREALDQIVFCLPASQVQSSSAAAKELLLLSKVINQTVGDAISGVLLVDAVLR